MRLRSISLLFLLLPGAALADVVFTDNTLNLSNYTSTQVYTTGPGVTYTLQNCANCGYTGIEGLQELVDTPSGGGGIFFGLTNNTFTYDPQTEGAIDSIDTSVETDATFNRAAAGGFTPYFFPLIEQSGVYYISDELSGTPTSGTTTGYQNIAGYGLESTDFTQFDFSTQSFGSANPDFSATAAPIIFGIAPLVYLNDQFQAEIDYSNLSFDLSTEAVPVTTPEPATLVPLALVLACLSRCRAKTKAPA